MKISDWIYKAISKTAHPQACEPSKPPAVDVLSPEYQRKISIEICKAEKNEREIKMRIHDAAASQNTLLKNYLEKCLKIHQDRNARIDLNNEFARFCAICEHLNKLLPSVPKINVPELDFDSVFDTELMAEDNYAFESEAEKHEEQYTYQDRQFQTEDRYPMEEE